MTDRAEHASAGADPEAAGPITIGVVDDHPLVGAGLSAVIAQRGTGGAGERGIRVVATDETVSGLQAQLSEPPCAVLLDIRLADSSTPTDNTKRLLAWGTRVLIYTQGDQHEQILRALQAGASGVVHKQDPVEELIEAVEIIVRDEFRFTADGQAEKVPGQFVSRRLAQALEVLIHRAPNANLTNQELEAVRLYASGMPGKHVASVMHLSEATVKTYLRRAKDKLIQEGFEAGTKHDLRTAAIKLGIIPPISLSD